jgi:hypothetical protein
VLAFGRLRRLQDHTGLAHPLDLVLEQVREDDDLVGRLLCALVNQIIDKQSPVLLVLVLLQWLVEDDKSWVECRVRAAEIDDRGMHQREDVRLNQP